MTAIVKRLLLAASFAAIAIPAANAQVVRGDQIVAQSNYVSRQQVAIPQVSIVVRADFVLFSVRYETGTRSLDERESELEKTFGQVTQRAGRTNGDIVIEVGQPGNSAAIETAALKEVVMDMGERSYIDLVLKVAVKPTETFDTIRARTEKFVKETPVKKHRETLIKAIADDLRLMQATFGGPNSPVRVSLSGMEQRAQTRPVGPLDLEIYIPYSMSLVSGSND